MGARVLHRLDQLIDDMLRGRLVGVPHAEIDDVVALGPGAGLHGVDLGEDVGRQAPNAVELLFHGSLVQQAGTGPGARPR